MNHRYGVKVMPRDVILDTQGRAVEQTLELRKLSAKCRVGKFIELEIEGPEEEGLKRAEEIAKFVLCNPLIEKFEILKL
jgi:phosphoribosylformylglycinamidine (FGAM) synthase PurS component